MRMSYVWMVNFGFEVYKYMRIFNVGLIVFWDFNGFNILFRVVESNGFV